MPRSRLALSGYRAVWLLAMFDLPVTTKAARKEYARFRKALLRAGFSMLQFSVYARYLASEDAAEPFKRRIESELPDRGEVRLVLITDRQFGKMIVFFGKKRSCAEKPSTQLLLF
jgi:CRISPR-associated protein Cas2